MGSYIARMLTALFLGIGFASGPGWAATVEEGVAATFAKFKQAMAARDGVIASRYIDDRTAAFYEKIHRAALTMPQDQLLRQSRFFQLEVFSTRLLVGKSEIENIDGRELYAKLAAAGATGVPDSLDLVKIRPTRPGASALVYVSLAGRARGVGLRVFTEGGVWKIDLTRLIGAATKKLQKQIPVAPGMSRNAAQLVIERDLFPLIARQSGKPVSEKLWTPLASAN